MSKKAGRCTNSYRCPYSVEKAFGAYHLVYSHIAYNHEEASTHFQERARYAFPGVY